MAVKTKKISTLIESQLPSFISSEYELFSKFVQKYYEQQESQGQSLDIALNLDKYANIDFYEKSILNQSTILTNSISSSDTTILVADAEGFPEKNGYLQIGNEIIFYAERSGNLLIDCSRGISGNTQLGDIYEKSTFVTTDAAAHNSGSTVLNISNLFLYGLIKSFEAQYLEAFPEKYLKGEVDKRTLIKNIRKFYKSKGTDASIKFIFNTIVSDEKPSVYKPRDFTYKSSESDWVNIYAIKVKVVSGDPKTLIGNSIVQLPTDEYGYASATVDNVFPDGTLDDEKIWNIVVAPETVNGLFSVSTKTRLEKDLLANSGKGKRIDVFSTIGWGSTGEVLIGDEVISFSDKNVTQFVIDSRGSTPVLHEVGEFVYKPVTLEGSGVKLLTLGIVYNLNPKQTQPYSAVGDEIQVSTPGFSTIDPKVVITGTNTPRWILSIGSSVDIPTIPALETTLDGVSTDVAAIFEDEQYYYISSSSFPSYKILDGSTVDKEVLDQKLLRIIRKEATTTTEVYKTPKRDVGILLNGVPIYGYKDQESVRFGILEEIKVDTQGTGYAKPPFVLIDGVPNQARAVLSGQVVERIIVDTQTVFPRTPDVTITSGRGAVVRAVVTGGKVTSLIIDNPGEFYSSPPLVRIRDNAGRGRFADYTAIVNTDGKITGFIKNEEGNFYNQETVIVDIIPVGKGASGTPFLKEWNKNRFTKLSSLLDTDYGYIFQNYNNILEYGYGHVANPKALRVALNDNINNAGSEPQTKIHSPIIGFAYDGNPIYGPFGYEDPLNPQSSIVRMTSSYFLNNNRPKGPSTRTYPLGTFVNDYNYIHKSGSLDQNNGRFCVTPDFPSGTYAYFLTIDAAQVPQFPYFIGENFYSLPVDSNYNSNINQNDVPKKSRRLFVDGMPRNGEGLIAQIAEVKSGTVDDIEILESSDNFSTNSKIYFDNKGSGGEGVEAVVDSIRGKSVNYLQSKETKVVQLTTIQTAYLFANDTLRQPSSGAYGEIVGTVANDNLIVLKNVSGVFNNTGTFSADIKTFSVLIDQDSSYTEGAILSLTDGINLPIATAEILEGTSRQNVVKIKVLSGTWIVDEDYFIQSSDLFNTSGSRIIQLVSLSDNLEPFDVNQSVALIETNTNHGLGIGDEITVDINPDDLTKTKEYFVRKRLYQTVKFVPPSYTSEVDFTGIGRFQILNGGDDYTPGTYSNVSLTGGSGSGAKATITVSSSGIVNSVILQDGGSGYKKADYLSVDDEDLGRSLASLGNARLIIYVDHVGFASGATSLFVKDSIGASVGDLLQIGKEVVEISSILDNKLTVIRARKGTENSDHFNGQTVELYEPKYNFINNFQLSNNTHTGYIKEYNYETQEATIVFSYATQKLNAEQVQISTSFFDSSTPKKLVEVQNVSSADYKFEFSEDNLNFIANPNINIQEYYRYKFDTSHSSLVGTYFDISPSKNYNLTTEEKLSSTILPGSTGSFTDVKFGFGSRLSSNSYSDKVGTKYSNFYYFDKNGIVNSDDAYLQIVRDPLQGTKKLTYVTPTRFVYQLSDVPLWDGSGDVTYTTSGQFAIGKINSIKLINLGLNYKKSPIVIGCDPTSDYKAKASVLFDYSTNSITGVRVDKKGSNYSNPKVIITNSDGTNAAFDIVVRNGEIFSITVKNPGKGYTFAPEIEIVESSIEAYAYGSNIGVPQSVRLIRNGGAYHLDKTVSSSITSQYTFSLRNISGNYQKGEIVVQKINGNEVARGIVSEWRSGSNLLKLQKISGIFRTGYAVQSTVTTASGIVKSVFVTTFEEQIESFYDNLGYYTSDRGKIGIANQKISDSYFYQDYSYVIQSKTPINTWRDLIKSTTHPAGFQLFGQVDIETDSSSTIPQQTHKNTHYSIVQLWDPDKNKITVENTRRTITQTVQKIENQRIKKSAGSAAPSEFNFNEYRAFEFTLNGTFNGYYDNDGRLQGTTMFQVLDANGNPFTPINANSLIVTLDGILQEPGVAYTVQADKIIFSQPPLGPGQTRTGVGANDLTTYRGVTFYGKYFSFKDNQYNTRYLRKIRNIFQRNGRWLDAANQIDRNRTFIVEESIGYGKSKYPTLDWSTKLDDYQRDIGYILDAFQHDLRFGGNVKTVDYIGIFKNDSAYDYITKNKVKSLDIFKYASNLAALSIRNWDIVETVNYIQGSTRVTVQDTNRLAVGMWISSGRAFASGTKIVSINSQTEITVSSAALANSGGGGGAPDGTTLLSGSTSGSTTIATNTGAVQPGNTFSVEPGDNLTVPVSFSGSDQATFYLSGINTGTYYDASNLIAANKEYLQEEISEYIYDTYNLPQTDKTKCKRDLGYLIDAIVYHLRFGGNQKVVEFARSYYTFGGYPYGENLTYINRTVEETTAAIDAWDKLGEKMILAMRNTLGSGSYTTITPYIDNSISIDSISPVCQEVASTINTFVDIVKDIIENGAGVVEITPINQNKTGNWSNTPTYSNYNLIADPLLPSQECDDVISALNSLYANTKDILDKKSVTRSLPDYVDGENKIFELYWENGDEVITDEDEDLFLTINAVLQRPKYTQEYPLFDSYYIDRTVVPNKLVFDVAPIWDQDFSAKSIGEPTAVEKVVGIGVGNYKRLTIDYNLVDDIKSGPFLILDVEDYTVQNIEDTAFLYVFLDGVLQREGFSYTVSGPNIFFNVPILKEMKIDMRYLYGRDVGQILNIYDFNPDSYFAKSLVTLEISNGLNDLLNFSSWMGNKVGYAIHAYQIKQDGTYNMIGECSNFYAVGNTLSFNTFGNKCDIIQDQDIYFGVSGFYNLNVSCSISNATISYEEDENGRLLLSTLEQAWSGTILGRTYRRPFVNLSNSDLMRVEGEEKFRKIKKLPGITTSKEHRNNQQVSNSMFGQVDVETYNGITRGEGLSVVAKIQNGKVISLEWNQRSYNPLTQPTAYQYYTPPVLHFIPLDGNGGGAKANVLVSKGQVISIDLIDGGSGYTEAPKVIVARRFDILSERDIGVSLINVGINPYAESSGITAFSTVNILGNQIPSVLSFFAIVFDSPTATDREIESEIQLVEQNDNISHLKTSLITTRPNIGAPLTFDLDSFRQFVSVISGRIQDVISTSIIKTDRQITTSFENLIPNDALSNINYYATGAYLDVDLDIDDNIVYITDTSKFKSNGYLLIGDEIVRYYRKLGDRFLKVQRGQQNTTSKAWTAGTFLRQIPDPISTVFGGVTTVESESQITTVQVGLETGNLSQRTTQIQTLSPSVDVNTSSTVVDSIIQIEEVSDSVESVTYKYLTEYQLGNTVSSLFSIETQLEIISNIKSIETEVTIKSSDFEVVVIPPESGFIDYYQETLFISDTIPTRLSGNVVLVNTGVVQRNLNVIFVVNQISNNGSTSTYRGSYTITKLGPTIGSFSDVFTDDGSANVSGLTIEQINIYYPDLTIGDFTDRKNSSYLLSSRYFDLVRPSAQNSMAIVNATVDTSATTFSIPTTQNLTHFPSSGYLYIGHSTENFGVLYSGRWAVVSYTSKFGSTFNGCTLISRRQQPGDGIILQNAKIVPFQLT